MKPTMKGTILFAAGVIVGLAGAWRLVPRPDPLPPYQRVEEEAGLDRVVSEVHFDGTRLDEAIKTLASQTRANIRLRVRNLEAAGIDEGAPVTLTLHDVRLRIALREILETVGGATTKLGCSVDGGVIFISTDEDFSRRTDVRMYDIGDLMDQYIDEVMNGRVSSIQAALDRMPDFSLIAAPNGPRQLSTDLIGEASDMLVKVVEESVSPDSWRDAGGSSGSIRYFSRKLIITATPENHDEVARLLQRLRSGGVK
jgi:hypothetical protein